MIISASLPRDDRPLQSLGSGADELPVGVGSLCAASPRFARAVADYIARGRADRFADAGATPPASLRPQ